MVKDDFKQAPKIALPPQKYPRMCATLPKWQVNALQASWTAEWRFPSPVPAENWVGPMDIPKAFLDSPRLALAHYASRNGAKEI